MVSLYFICQKCLLILIYLFKLTFFKLLMPNNHVLCSHTMYLSYTVTVFMWIISFRSVCCVVYFTVCLFFLCLKIACKLMFLVFNKDSYTDILYSFQFWLGFNIKLIHDIINVFWNFQICNYISTLNSICFTTVGCLFHPF